MIPGDSEYERVREQLALLERWLVSLGTEPEHPNKGLSRAGIHTMMARLHDELAACDGERALREREAALL